jgi:DNA-directed RNA polymerase specialized sigma subunit
VTQSIEELALKYQETGDASIFELITKNGDIEKITWKFARERVWGYDMEDLRQELLLELEKACLQYNGKNKLSTLFWSFAKRRIYASPIIGVSQKKS